MNCQVVLPDVPEAKAARQGYVQSGRALSVTLPIARMWKEEAATQGEETRPSPSPNTVVLSSLIAVRTGNWGERWETVQGNYKHLKFLVGPKHAFQETVFC